MQILKIVARVLLVLLILVFGVQTILATLRVVGALSSTGMTPRLLGQATGSLTVPLLLLILCGWGFLRLGAKPRTETRR